MSEQQQFDVFLSHASQDKPLVEALAKWLMSENVAPWLDKWNLIPGEPWQTEIEQALASSKSCAVFIGPSDLGPWQNEEMRAAINRRVTESGRKFRVIPVLLPGAQKPGNNSLPTFLTATTWVQFKDSVDDEQARHRLISGIRGIAPRAGPGEAIVEGSCPYLGLRHFEENDAPLFHGRRAYTDHLVRQVQDAMDGKFRYRFLGIVGPSGSGKSSLARAGLLPAIRAGKVVDSANWPVLVLRPGHDPVKNLAATTKRVLELNEPLAEMVTALKTDSESLDLFIRLGLPESPTQKLVLLVDQFEELFTLCSDQQVRELAINNLMYAADAKRNPDGRTVLVITMRADFYGRCAEHRELAESFSQNQLLVGPMTEEELHEAIEQPARLAGCDFEAGLVETLLRAVQNQPGALPLLEHVLLEVWERRSGHRLGHQAYNDLGKLAGALEQKAEEAFNALSESQQTLCRHVFLRLTRIGEGTEDTKQRVRLEDLVNAEEDLAEVETVVESLVTARLLTTSNDTPGQRAVVEVAHESLIAGWPRLRKWLDEDRDALHALQKLTDAAREWDDYDRDASYLYLGHRLVNALQLLEQNTSDLNPLERAFLGVSRTKPVLDQLVSSDTDRMSAVLAELIPLAEHARPELRRLFERAEQGSRQHRNCALALIANDDLTPLKHSPPPRPANATDSSTRRRRNRLHIPFAAA